MPFYLDPVLKSEIRKPFHGIFQVPYMQKEAEVRKDPWNFNDQNSVKTILSQRYHQLEEDFSHVER